jgi:hypothetical protein
VSPDDFSKIATPLVWPAIALVVLCLFYRPVRALLQRLAETLTFKSLKVKVFGTEIELAPEYARTVLHELLGDIAESTNELTREEVGLFFRIRSANGAKTVAELIPSFRRDDPEGNHERLRNLRDQKLIIPRERGQWKPDKHPVVTRYGELVAKLHSTRAEKIDEFKRQTVG